MILKASLYSAAGVALLSSSTTDAFIPSKRTTRALQLRSSLNRDWDNGDFLSSLSGSPNEIAEANAKYQAQSQNRAQINEWRVRQMQSSTQLNASSGAGGGDARPSPELLKRMGLTGEEIPNQLRQQNQAAMPPPSGMAPPQQPSAAQFQGQPQIMQQPPQQPLMQQQQFYDQNGNPVSMPMLYDQHGNIVPYYPPYQQMAHPQQVQQVNPGSNFVPAPYEPPLPPTTKQPDSEGARPVGYNPDAYTMSNTADVYFAQLKQDSKVRKRAWLAGDIEAANEVFTDKSVTSIRDQWVENPYTKEKNMQEARAEIEGAVRMQVGGNDTNMKLSSGVSYKEKLEQMKAKRGGGGAVQQQPPQQQPPPPPQQPQKAVMTKPPPPVQAAAPAPKMQQPPPRVQQQPSPVQPKVGVPASPPRTKSSTTTLSASKAATSAALPGALAEDEKRRDLRTLQGLLLKQRGGPGFGAGRLRETEAHRLENTLKKVIGILRSEDADFIAGTDAAAAAAAATPPVARVPKPIQKAQSVQPAKPTQPAQPIQHAQQMQSTPPPAQSQVDPMTGAIACVEAALKMYQDASPAEREVMMIPLREALMAAASGANKVIAEAELNANKAAMSAGPPKMMPSMQQAKPMMGFPTTYAVTKAENPAGSPDSDNISKLTNAYNALTGAQGSGKLGLRNLSGSEANALANQVESMRGVLLDELNN